MCDIYEAEYLIVKRNSREIRNKITAIKCKLKTANVSLKPKEFCKIDLVNGTVEEKDVAQCNFQKKQPVTEFEVRVNGFRSSILWVKL